MISRWFPSPPIILRTCVVHTEQLRTSEQNIADSWKKHEANIVSIVTCNKLVELVTI